MNYPVIETQDLTKYYGEHLGIAGLNLEVRPGEVFAFLGPNGSGKTTTIRILLDLIRPTKGRARIFGMDSRADSLSIRKRVGYLPGDLATYENLTGQELLTFFANLNGGVDPGYTAVLAGRLDLDLSRPIRGLSKGNKQKIGIVQAFMTRPELMIMDEPTSGLDPLVRQEFYSMLQEAKASGQIVFLSSHVLAEVERTADRVAFIRQGGLVLVDEVEVLKERAPRRVELHFAGAAPVDAFRGVPGVRNLTADANAIYCTTEGSMDPLIKAAARFEVAKIETHEPDVEEIFLTYYREDSR